MAYGSVVDRVDGQAWAARDQGSRHEPASGAAARNPAERILATRVGLRIPTNLTYGGWELAGQQISRLIDSSAWCLGDWLVYGQDRYSDRYRHAVAAVGLDYQTLRNYAWVARRFELRRRRPLLSFQHHAELASLPVPEQEQWLVRAQENTWSRNELRRHVRGQAAQRRSARESPGVAAGTLPGLRATTDQVQRWREAAAKTDSDFERWVVAALDSAAARVLGLPAAPLDDTTGLPV